MSSTPRKRWSFPLRRRPSNSVVARRDTGDISLDDYEPFLVRKQRRDGHGSLFILPLSDPLARKRTFHSQWTVLPSEVADIPCRNMCPAQLLVILNSIFKTQRRLSGQLHATLADFILNGCDLGQIYGEFRGYWSYRWPNLQKHIQDRRKKDHEMRESMITDDLIVSPFVPPRRVWDLYANRIVPYYHYQRHSYIYPVSHSWRPPSERHSVLTTINGKEWRVPIPRDTTLDAIRNELLLLGAEYAWLDVLCLRQFDEHLPEQEVVRKHEWRLDIPTIGHVYSGGSGRRPVIIWFNGLGRPFCEGPVDPEDAYHWMNRVWTLQELTPWIIVGGLQEKVGVIDLSKRRSWPHGIISEDFLTLLRSQPMQLQLQGRRYYRLSSLTKALRRRSCSNPVDQVACLTYFMLKKIPTYDPATSPDVAWNVAMKHMDGDTRTELLFADFGPRAQPTWQPTWEEFIHCTTYAVRIWQPMVPLPTLYLKLIGDSVLGSESEVFTYWHDAYVIQRISIDILHSDEGDRALISVNIPVISRIARRLQIRFTVPGWRELADNGVDYVLIGGPCSVYGKWVVAKKVGTQVIDGRTAMKVIKVSAIKLCPYAHTVLAQSVPMLTLTMMLPVLGLVFLFGVYPVLVASVLTEKPIMARLLFRWISTSNFGSVRPVVYC